MEVKKIIKKTTLILIICLLLSITGIWGHAENPDVNGIEIQYHADCPDSPDGIHSMNLIGRGFLYQEDRDHKIQKKLIENGNTFRCEHCGHYFICTGRPQLGWPVADYLTSGDMSLYGMLHNSIFEFRTDYSETNYTSDNTIKGYRFK